MSNSRSWISPKALCWLLVLVLCSSACRLLEERTRLPMLVAPPERPDRIAPEGLELSGVARAESIALGSYVRIQALPMKKWGSRIPYGDYIDRSRASNDIATVDYTAAFRAMSGWFVEEVIEQDPPGPSAAVPLTLEIRLVRSAYDPESRTFRQVVTARVVDSEGLVIFKTSSEVRLEGDLPDDLDLPVRALRESFARLGRNIRTAQARIASDIKFYQQERHALEEILQRAARRFGRQESQNSRINGVQHAVIIGISDYPRAADRLLGAKADALEVFATLTDPTNELNFESSNVALLLDEAATLRNIRAALALWSKRRVGPDDLMLVFYAGHGRYAEDDETGRDKKEKYFLPYDYYSVDSSVDGRLPMDEVTQYFKRLRGKSAIMIFDACHAGAAELGDVTDELRRFSRAARATRTHAIFASAKANQEAIELRSSRRGIFTVELVLGLRGEADSDGDGRVSLVELGDHVARAVPAKARIWDRVQEPVFVVNDRDRAAQIPLAGFARSALETSSEEARR